MPGSNLCEYSVLHIDIRHYTYYSGTLSSWLDISSEKALNRSEGNVDEGGYYGECEERLGIMTEYTGRFYQEVHRICEKVRADEAGVLNRVVDTVYAGDGIYYAFSSKEYDEITIVSIPIEFARLLIEEMPRFFEEWNQVLKKNNLLRHNKELDFTVALHYGYLSPISIPAQDILSSNQQESTLIGPAINVVTKVEKLSKLFDGVRVIISEKFVDEMSEAGQKGLTELSSARVVIEGIPREEPLKLYTF